MAVQHEISMENFKFLMIIIELPEFHFIGIFCPLVEWSGSGVGNHGGGID